ncbi:MAG: hypothetical protein GXO35_03155, partial [Gammaproteobacteria bacterium]|nr:hypothetical protein [Gammaproteobacteria bacterium]
SMSHAGVEVANAYDAYQSGDYELAQSLYDQTQTYDGWFGAGASAYQQEDNESAVLYFRQAAWQAEQPTQRAHALFNLGNSYYKANLLPQAIDAYQQALLYQSNYPNATNNLALTQQRKAVEDRGKQAHKDQSGKGDGEGSGGKDSEGAFYGGQKPNNSDSSESGFGSDGDAEGGNKRGEKALIPQVGEMTDYRLLGDLNAFQFEQNSSEQSTGQRMLIKQQRLQQAEAFEHQLQQLQDDQKTLLRRIFEREAGFHAAQTQPHPIPGVQPW